MHNRRFEADRQNRCAFFPLLKRGRYAVKNNHG